MKPITVVITAQPHAQRILDRLVASGLVDSAIIQVPPETPGISLDGSVPVRVQATAMPHGSDSVMDLLDHASTQFILQVVGDVDPHPRALQRMVETARDSAAVLVYGDYIDAKGLHPLADCQVGSLEDRFDFGPLRLWSRGRLGVAIAAHGRPTDLSWQAWYDLRLKAQQLSPVVRLPEPLGTLHPEDQRASGERVFDYLTATRDREIEAEAVVSAHLERVGAKVGPEFKRFPATGSYPVEASVIIPVRDRARTVMDAVDSALSQDTGFSFNVIVVDNHSSDGTTKLLAERAAADDRLVHIVPERHDLGIGGCWNEGVFHAACGRYVVQLDSDDIYAGPDALRRMVELLRDEQCGMAVGSYSLVDFDLKSLPPGLIDHREWTPDNGPNNALRVGGMGAPRAFATELLRAHPFPNASYGEDYAVALRISREYHVGRIFDSLYLCRRWEDNSDADLPAATKARYQTYKDRLRSLELQARQRLGDSSRHRVGS